MKKRELNEKQKLFVQQYLVDFNATQAAIRSGYSPKTAVKQGSRLLTNADIQEHIEIEKKKTNEELIAKREDVLKYLTAVMIGESKSSVLALDVGGGQKTINKPPDEKERLKAAELLGKYHSIFTDNTKITGVVPIVIVDDMSDDDG